MTEIDILKQANECIGWIAVNLAVLCVVLVWRMKDE